MDKTGDGQVTIEDLSGVYDVSLNPDVVAGKMTEEEALRKFLDAFDSKNKDGIVTQKEFKDYYRNIGASIDDDDYFELMIRNAWHISGGKGAYANTTCRRVLVTHTDGRQTVEEITDDLGIAPDDIKMMKRNLLKRGIKAKAIKTFGQAGAAKGKKFGKKNGKQSSESKSLEGLQWVEKSILQKVRQMPHSPMIIKSPTTIWLTRILQNMRKKSENLADSQTGLKVAQLIVQLTAASPTLPPKGLFHFQMGKWQTRLKHTAWCNDYVAK